MSSKNDTTKDGETGVGFSDTNESHNSNVHEERPLEFMEFKKRFNRLVEELIRHRPDNTWNRESVAMELKSDEIELEFSVTELAVGKVMDIIDLFQRSFESNDRFKNSTVNYNPFIRTMIQKSKHIQLSIKSHPSYIGHSYSNGLTLVTSIKGFTQHFEYFASKLAEMLYPQIQVQKPDPPHSEKINEKFKTWYKEHGWKLESAGCQVILEPHLQWEELVGLDAIKQVLQTNILTPIQREDLFKKITAKVSPHPVSVLPRGVLLYGPPGTGKTWSLKVLGSIAELPVVVLPCQALMSKWYGESEQTLGNIFVKLKDSGKVILLIDELDAIARHRQGAHESTARLVSILLSEMDGLTEKGEILLIASANNTDLIDPAVLDRFDIKLEFPRPHAEQLQRVLGYYARHLSDDDLAQIISKMNSLNTSGCNFRQVAKFAEEVLRSYVSALDISMLESDNPPLPRVEDYLKAVAQNSTT